VSKSRLRARLDRLERSVSTAVADPFGFNIDPTLAKSLRDDCDRVFSLGNDLDTKKAKSADERADITKERERISASISERAKTITCPVGYGPVQAREDSKRAARLRDKRTCGIGLTDAEDAEEAQLKARVCAYRESPEGRARAQIFNLTIRSWLPRGCSPAQREELDRLQAIYPGPIVEI
jgi:hypothetical protein